MPRFLTPALVLVMIAVTGCSSHHNHLQYDLGRATTQAFRAQADLSRPSVADSAYALTGTEAMVMRERVTEVSTDQESGEAEAVKQIQVQ
jgi:hypothetical protein